MYSLSWARMVSMTAMRSNCRGLVLPRTAPNVMSTVAEAKSHDNILKNTNTIHTAVVSRAHRQTL